jgi:hypothetical protein
MHPWMAVSVVPLGTERLVGRSGMGLAVTEDRPVSFPESALCRASVRRSAKAVRGAKGKAATVFYGKAESMSLNRQAADRAWIPTPPADRR